MRSGFARALDSYAGQLGAIDMRDKCVNDLVLSPGRSRQQILVDHATALLNARGLAYDDSNGGEVCVHVGNPHSAFPGRSAV